ncbi:MAG: hypothetical protein ACE5GB_08480 [Acidimicrobiales bacterium]
MPRLAGVLVATVLIAAACGGAGATEGATDATSADPGGPAAADDAAASGGSAGEGVLDFTGTTVDGTQIDFGDLAGRDLILWFWAPW